MSLRAPLVAAIVAFIAAPSAAAPLAVTVRLDNLTCTVPTERTGGNNRDEVTLDVIAVQRGAAPVKRRLPRSRFDDYYEFWAGTDGAARGFTNRDQVPQGVPQLWEGVLSDGETVLVVVRINEQDNKQLPLIKALLLQGLDQAEQLVAGAVAPHPGAPPALPGADLAELYDQVAGVFAALPKKAKDDFIGAFAVTITNDGGAAPAVTWAPLAQLTATAAEHRLGAAWDADGTGGAKYHLAASVDAHANLPPPAPPLRYVGIETDRCDADTIEIAGSGGGPLRKGDSALVEPRFTPERRFLWRCGDSDERSRCRDRSATTIRAIRAKEGRRVRWGCFAP